ncbi:hypothetical protein NONO_c68510 [Nocardia nova SH22a]|uniref:Uncharacterized protein n=1 Tax=Nocardia nova SH22a TaxID=1415166 RepID=W5TRQ0_9NOCA|nr:hypothetical protein [Nocardia nova]AHH21618.1 hypothetical protein NONO_c68510 [Nocardia nova SH22a]
MSGRISATVRGHWVNAWFLRLAARPVLLVDGHEHPARWDRATTLPVEAGTHTLAAGIRYRGTPWLLGVLDHEIQVGDDRTVHVTARNGALNSEPFHLTAVEPG